MARRDRRNELLAGALILLAGALVVAILLVLADWRGLVQSKHEVLVIFRDQSVKGLTEGATVEFNGVPVGTVRELRLDYTNPNEIRAVLSVPRDLKLYTNASLYVGTAALGGTAWIAIVNVGGPELSADGTPALPADTKHPILGLSRPNTLIADVADTVGLGDTQRTQLQQTIASIHATARSLEATMAEVHDDLLPRARRIASSLSQSVETFHAAMAKADESLANVRDVTATARQLALANRDSLSDAIANFREGSEHYAAALAEIRREPWRLLYKPKPSEIEASNVMVAARAFAEGAGRLRDTATRLSAMTAQPYE